MYEDGSLRVRQRERERMTEIRTADTGDESGKIVEIRTSGTGGDSEDRGEIRRRPQDTDTESIVQRV